MKKFLVTTVALGMLAWAGSASANLITNGDFEDNGGSLDGWDVTTGIDIAQAGAITDIQGMNGHYALFGLRTSSDNSTLRQDFEVQGIDELTVSFDWAFDVVDWDETADDTFLSFLREDDTNEHRITMQKLQSSAIIDEYGFAANYGHYEETFSIADWLDDEGRVIFRLKEDISCLTLSLAGIDNVSVTGPAPVPEPATMLLMGTGLAGMVAVRRKKKANKA